MMSGRAECTIWCAGLAMTIATTNTCPRTRYNTPKGYYVTIKNVTRFFDSFFHSWHDVEDAYKKEKAEDTNQVRLPSTIYCFLRQSAINFLFIFIMSQYGANQKSGVACLVWDPLEVQPWLAKLEARRAELESQPQASPPEAEEQEESYSKELCYALITIYRLIRYVNGIQAALRAYDLEQNNVIVPSDEHKDSVTGKAYYDASLPVSKKSRL